MSALCLIFGHIPFHVQGAALSEQDLMSTIQAAAAEADELIKAQHALVGKAGRHTADLPMLAQPDPAALQRIALLSQQCVQDILADEGRAGCQQRGQQLEAAKASTLTALRAAGAVRSEASSALAPSLLLSGLLHLYLCFIF